MSYYKTIYVFNFVNKTACHEITELLLKVALNTTTLNLKLIVNITYTDTHQVRDTGGNNMSINQGELEHDL
jgi:hypothetical protein